MVSILLLVNYYFIKIIFIYSPKGSDILKLKVSPNCPYWVVQVAAGCEYQVAKSLQYKLNNKLQSTIKLHIAEENVTEIRSGYKKTVRKNLFPGYIFIEFLEMDAVDDIWLLVTYTNQVISILGSVSRAEIEKFLCWKDRTVYRVIEPSTAKVGAAKKVSKLSRKVERLLNKNKNICEKKLQKLRERIAYLNEKKQEFYAYLVACNVFPGNKKVRGKNIVLEFTAKEFNSVWCRLLNYFKNSPNPQWEALKLATLIGIPGEVPLVGT